MLTFLSDDKNKNQKYLFFKTTAKFICTDWNFLFDLYFAGTHFGTVLGLPLAGNKQIGTG